MTKQVLDIKQMQHLQKLGLELKDTLFYWAGTDTESTLVKDGELIRELVKSCNKIYIPAYTLQDVLDALPPSISYAHKLHILRINLYDKAIYYQYPGDYDILVFDTFRQTPMIDSAYSLMCWAIEQGYIETNKTNEHERDTEEKD